MCTKQPRFSVFGWFLQPGQLYKLFQGDDADHVCHTTGADSIQHKAIEVQQAESCQTVCTFANAHDTADVGMFSMNTKHCALLSPYANSPHGLSTLLASKTLPDRRKRLSRLKAA